MGEDVKIKITSGLGDTRFLNLNVNSIDALREFLDQKEKDIYLDYINNFVTVDAFADAYEIEYMRALELINKHRGGDKMKYQIDATKYGRGGNFYYTDDYVRFFFKWSDGTLEEILNISLLTDIRKDFKR